MCLACWSRWRGGTWLQFVVVEDDAEKLGLTDQVFEAVLCDKLAKFLSFVELEGVWSDGIRDAHVAMTLTIDGDAPLRMQ